MTTVNLIILATVFVATFMLYCIVLGIGNRHTKRFNGAQVLCSLVLAFCTVIMVMFLFLSRSLIKSL